MAWVTTATGVMVTAYLAFTDGTTTFGTQGAVEYACREKSVQELLLRLSVSDTGELKPFEALLHVKIAKGVPVETDLVSLRKVFSP